MNVEISPEKQQIFLDTIDKQERLNINTQLSSLPIPNKSGLSFGMNKKVKIPTVIAGTAVPCNPAPDIETETIEPENNDFDDKLNNLLNDYD